MSDSPPSQLPLLLRQAPKATGDIWAPSKTHPATVPVPLPVVMVRVDGPFTALDRKLWLVLLHHAWDELDSDKSFHEISIAEIVRLFRRFGRTDLGTKGKVQFGKTEEETDAAMLWDSIRRLVKTSVEWEDEDYQSISHLINEAMLNKKYRETGKLYYSFGRMLSKNILAPRAFARLRCHVVLALRGKYAVTLYEVLEAYVNRRESSLIVSIDDLRSWLKVSEDATSYNDWKDLKRRVIGPAVDEINQHGEEGGFFVTYEGVREGKAYTKVRFTLAKSAARDDRDTRLQGKARRGRAFKAPVSLTPLGTRYEPTDAVLDQIRSIAPGWDRQALLARYREWSRDKATPDNPHGAFIGWAKRFTKKEAAG
jgi:Initiator Replication protein